MLLAGGSYGPGQLSYHQASKLSTPEPVALAKVVNLGVTTWRDCGQTVE